MGLRPVKSKFCRNFYTGDIFQCSHYQTCCRDMCCTAPFSFINLWYFWIFILLLLCLCSGGGYWYKRRYSNGFITSSAPNGLFGSGFPSRRGFLGASSLFGASSHPRPFYANTAGGFQGYRGNMYYQAPFGGPKPPQYFYPDQGFYYNQNPNTCAPPPSYQELYRNQQEDQMRNAPNPNAFPSFPNPSVAIPMPPPSNTTTNANANINK
ncbi:unnamed protein product [Gordionus sp. m RMFG-2023]|uniref:WW domain binding protein VOPP1-like isoform X2 n=1 Tax=Gordionus sp. m RMFG-2023 TaxID=3053472 RepID=UPI0030DEC8B2